MQSISIANFDKTELRTSEAFKTLRSNIRFCGPNIKTIVITSTVPNEGKSSIALHLAAAMAQIGDNVLFIDTDMRKSVLTGRYRMGKVQKGLSNFLSGQDDWEDCVCGTDIKNLEMVLAGPIPPNPCELLDSVWLQDKLTELREVYDYIIIDTPPIGSVIDGSVVAAMSDGAIIVVEANKLSYRMIRKTKNQLEKAGCRILGSVLNKVDVKKSSYGYGKYYSDYYSSSKEKDKKRK